MHHYVSFRNINKRTLTDEFYRGLFDSMFTLHWHDTCHVAMVPLLDMGSFLL